LRESYHLSIRLGSDSPIAGSPLENKILLEGGLVQAAHTRLVVTYTTLTAGETYTFTIEAQDAFQNVVLNTQDKIDFAVLGAGSLGSTVLHADMEYLFHHYEATFSLAE